MLSESNFEEAAVHVILLSKVGCHGFLRITSREYNESIIHYLYRKISSLQRNSATIVLAEHAFSEDSSV